MNSDKISMTQILLYICVGSAIGMVALGFIMPSTSIYIDICGIVCAASAFFLLGDPEIAAIDGVLKYFRYATVGWILFSIYRIYTKM